MEKDEKITEFENKCKEEFQNIRIDNSHTIKDKWDNIKKTL